LNLINFILIILGMSTLKNSIHMRMIIRKQVLQIINDDFTIRRTDRGLAPLSEKQIREFIINNLNDIERIIWNMTRDYKEGDEPEREWIIKYWYAL
jgi:3-methyladenine DNA glycosylase AlkC